ncbi:MAG: cupredoxin domain-containing protein [bacterium]|nr:cupredoxin domain-containing protein [bacterium]
MNTRLISPIMFATAAAVLLLGAGCRNTAPATPTAPATNVPEAPADAPLLFVAPAPTTPPPPDIPSTPTTPPTAADAIAPTPPPNAPRVIRVTAKQWEFVPAEIRVKKDEQVVLEVTSTDVDHGLSLPDFNINRTLKPGVTERIEFSPDKVGQFSMVCSVFCGQGPEGRNHRSMRGTLIVE